MGPAQINGSCVCGMVIGVSAAPRGRSQSRFLARKARGSEVRPVRRNVAVDRVKRRISPVGANRRRTVPRGSVGGAWKRPTENQQKRRNSASIDRPAALCARRPRGACAPIRSSSSPAGCAEGSGPSGAGTSPSGPHSSFRTRPPPGRRAVGRCPRLRRFSLGAVSYC